MLCSSSIAQSQRQCVGSFVACSLLNTSMRSGYTRATSTALPVARPSKMVKRHRLGEVTLNTVGDAEL